MLCQWAFRDMEHEARTQLTRLLIVGFRSTPRSKRPAPVPALPAIRLIGSHGDIYLRRIRYMVVSARAVGDWKTALNILEVFCNIVAALVYDSPANVEQAIPAPFLLSIFKHQIIQLSISAVDDLMSSWTTTVSMTAPSLEDRISAWHMESLLASCEMIVRFWGLVIRSEFSYGAAGERKGIFPKYPHTGGRILVENGMLSTLREFILRLYGSALTGTGESPLINSITGCVSTTLEILEPKSSPSF